MKKKSALHSFGSILLMACVLCGCAPRISKAALQLSPWGSQNRQLQTRSFDTDETTLLSASAAVLQDLGFTIDESETKLGTIVASKRSDATRRDQIARAIVIACFTGFVTPIDKEQIVRASLVTNPVDVEDPDKNVPRTAVRITFQRIVISSPNALMLPTITEFVMDATMNRSDPYQGRLARGECVNDPEIYRDFFEKLSQSLFLEAHGI